MSKLLAEIRRRRVIQTFFPYLGFVWLVLQIVSVITPALNWHPLVNTFFAVTLFAGIPVILYLSWYFDFTMQGLIPVHSNETKKVEPFGFLRWLLLLAITLGSGFFGYEYFHDIKTEYAKHEDGLTKTIQANSIAVLPFKDNSPDQDQAYLAIGLAEEVTNLLGRIQGLTVAASSSSAILQEKGLDPVSIARRLDVETVLTGSVRKSGDKLTVRAELINGYDGKVIWSESFARKFVDIFAVEIEIARSTVNLLQDTYIESGSLTNFANTNSSDAYVIYLRGREQYRKQTTESMKEARKLYEQAIGLDPEYAQAYVALANTLVLLAEGPERFGILKIDIAARLAKENIEKAVVREPDLPEAYAVLGYIPFMQNKPEQALGFFDKAISLNSNLAVVRLWKSQTLKRLQRHQESLDEMELAFRLDPLSVAVMHNLGFKYAERGDVEKAEAVFNQLISEYPTSPLGYAGMADVAFSGGNYARSLKYWKTTFELSPNNNGYRSAYIENLLLLNLTDQIRNLGADYSYYETNLLLQENRLVELFENYDFQVESNDDDLWIKFEAGWYNLLFGNEEKGINLITSLEGAISEEESYSMPWCSPAIEIAWSLMQKSQVESAIAIRTKCQKRLEVNLDEGIVASELDYLRARILALENRPDQALKALKEAVGKGWREWWTEHDPLFRNIRPLPEFQKQIDVIDADLEKQRIEALKLFED